MAHGGRPDVVVCEYQLGYSSKIRLNASQGTQPRHKPGCTSEKSAEVTRFQTLPRGGKHCPCFNANVRNHSLIHTISCTSQTHGMLSGTHVVRKWDTLERFSGLEFERMGFWLVSRDCVGFRGICLVLNSSASEVHDKRNLCLCIGTPSLN